jgi:invasion protein IalB
LFIVGALLGWIGRGVIAGPADVFTVQAYQDWRVICPARKEKDSHCRLESVVTDQQSGQTIASLSFVTEIDKDKKQSKVLIASVPLGVGLQPGLGLKIGGDTKTYAYRACLQAGCAAVIPVTDGLEQSIADAADTALVVAGDNDQAVSVPFSTKGYAEARRAYKNFEAKRSALWWRLWI